ncbi:MAG: hypothetical protein LBR42_03315 [Candidatus Methanoplasma sp.]|nr:hypothetical protein [Candidatus Methanoplasma sp.]
MQNQNKLLILICAILIASTLVGQVLLNVSPYNRTLNGDRDGDLALYDIDSNIYSDYAAMAFVSQQNYGITDYVICYGDDRIWFASPEKIDQSVLHLKRSLQRCSIQASVIGVEETLLLMQDSIENNSFSTAIIFVTGSLPNEIYDKENPLILEWLSAGGVMYWGNGPIGKYVSTIGEDELGEIHDYNLLFFGKEDVIRCDVRNVFDRDPPYEGLADVMRMLFNECTNGIDNSLLENSIDFGFEHESFKSVTLTKYHDGTGMIVVFGGTLNVNNALYASQVIASGINYSSVMIDFERGEAKSVSGELELSGSGIYTLFIYTGGVQGIFAKAFAL